MKSIPLRAPESGIKTVDIVRAVIERPAQGVSIEQMRASVRVLDALDALKPEYIFLHLEDADHATLVRGVNTMQFAVVSRELLAILDDILLAQAPSG